MDVENSNDESSLSGNRETGKSGEGSIFSQNLELNFKPAGQSRRMDLPSIQGDEIDSSERMTYFQIEASKVVDILREELDRLGESNGNIDLVEDLSRSWQALWGGGSETELVEFTALFDTVSQALRSAARCREAGLAAPEKLALGRLLQGMERLAGGRIGAEDVQWCREAGNRVSRMVAAWKSEDLRLDEKSQPQQAHGAQDDISSSIDEWFSQVSHFIPQSPEDELEVGDGMTIKPENNAGESDEGEPKEIGSERVDETAVVFEIEPETEPVETEDLILASAEQDGWEMPAGADESGRPAAIEPETRSPATEAAGEDIVIESASEGWLAEIYFSECCLDAAETIRNNVSRLESSTTGRTARMLSERVKYLIQLSVDFDMREMDGLLESLRELLENISPAGREDKSGDTQLVEQLLSALSTLERECEVAATPVW